MKPLHERSLRSINRRQSAALHGLTNTGSLILRSSGGGRFIDPPPFRSMVRPHVDNPRSSVSKGEFHGKRNF